MDFILAGIKMEIKRLKKSFKNGKRDGLSTSWYENGQKVSQGTFIAGKLNGVSTGWYKNGKSGWR